MTTLQVILWSSGYLVELFAVIYFTRPTARRVVGAIIGGAVVAWFVLCAIAACEALRWFHVPFEPTPWYLPLFYAGTVISCAPLYLITWRVARRFGAYGLAACMLGAAIIGPPRDLLIVKIFPSWMTFSPGLAPMLADSLTYFGIVAIGHAVSRLVAGPSCEDRLAPRPWESPKV